MAEGGCKVCGSGNLVRSRGWKCRDCISAGWKLDRFRRKRAQISDLTKRSLLAAPLFCRYCGIALSRGAWKVEANLHYDHVIPVRVGGLGHPANIVLSCRSCNHKKGGLHTVLLPVFKNALIAETDPAVLSVYISRSLVA